MSVQSDLLDQMRIFNTRLDDATRLFEQAPDEAGSYLSTQTILLTDLANVLCNAAIELADRLDRLDSLERVDAE